MPNETIERRRFGRRQTFKPAILVCDDGAQIEGTVIDISEGGARIRLADPKAAPKIFTLQIPADDFSAPCRLIHTSGDSIGVEYTASPRRLSWRPSSRRLQTGKPQDPEG